MDGTLYESARKRLAHAEKTLAAANSGGSDSLAFFLDLVSHLGTRDTDILLFLGSGVSKSVRVETPHEGAAQYVPSTWIELIERLFTKWAASHGDEATVRLREWHRHEDIKTTPQTIGTLLGRMDKLQVAWLVGELFNTQGDRGVRDRAIKELVQPTGPITSDLLKQMLRLPASVVVTPNYDTNIASMLKRRPRLQDRTLERAGFEGPIPGDDYLSPRLNGLTEIADHVQLENSFGVPGVHLYYLHGCVTHPSRRLVFDRFDYANLLIERDGLFDFVSYKLRTMPALYVGFGMDDPSFNLMENRLYRADGSRPESYAFVPFATSDECRWWSSRNLRVIQYGADHGKLCDLIGAIADVRRFLCWAEPERPAERGRDDNWVDSYLEASLRSYAKEDYMSSTQQARAALASTLFWGPIGSPVPVDRQFEERCQLVDVRVRLGMSHYKERYLKGRPEAIKRAEINVRAAREILDTLNKPADAGQELLLAAHGASVDVLHARIEYDRGRFERAREIYASVEKRLTALGGQCLRAPAKHLSYAELRGLECYAYSICQGARIDYQFVSGAPGGERRRKEAGELAELGSALMGVRQAIRKGAKGLSVETRKYFEESFNTIGNIARWFAGRNLVGAFGDVIPIKAERTRALYGQVRKGMKHLTIEAGKAKATSRISPRWRSLRTRYLARAHALTWFLDGQSPVGKARGRDARLKEAFRLAIETLELVGAPVLERDRIVSHQEMARIGLIAAFGITLNERQDGRGAVRFPLVVAAEHIAKSLDLVNAEVRPPRAASREYDQKDHMYLAALSCRLQAYVRLLSARWGIPSTDLATSRALVPSDDRRALAAFKRLGLGRADFDDAKQLHLVEAIVLYAETDAINLRQRAASLLATFRALSEELTGLP